MTTDWWITRVTPVFYYFGPRVCSLVTVIQRQKEKPSLESQHQRCLTRSFALLFPPLDLHSLLSSLWWVGNRKKKNESSKMDSLTYHPGCGTSFRLHNSRQLHKLPIAFRGWDSSAQYYLQSSPGHRQAITDVFLSLIIVQKVWGGIYIYLIAFSLWKEKGPLGKHRVWKYHPLPPMVTRKQVVPSTIGACSWLRPPWSWYFLRQSHKFHKFEGASSTDICVSTWCTRNPILS